MTLSLRKKGFCGRQRHTSQRKGRKIRVICLKNRKFIVRLLTKITKDGGVKISQRKVQRPLAEIKLFGIKPARKPRLTPAMTWKRLEWAHKYKHSTAENWNKLLLLTFCFALNNTTKKINQNAFFPGLLVESKSFFQVLTKKTKFVRRRPGQQNKPEHIIPTIKHSLSIIVWPLISGKGVGLLYAVENLIRQDQYKKVLETVLLPQIHKWFLSHEGPIFMLDGASCHKAKSFNGFSQLKKI